VDLEKGKDGPERLRGARDGVEVRERVARLVRRRAEREEVVVQVRADVDPAYADERVEQRDLVRGQRRFRTTAIMSPCCIDDGFRFPCCAIYGLVWPTYQLPDYTPTLNRTPLVYRCYCIQGFVIGWLI